MSVQQIEAQRNELATCFGISTKEATSEIPKVKATAAAGSHRLFQRKKPIQGGQKEATIRPKNLTAPGMVRGELSGRSSGVDQISRKKVTL